MPKEAPELAMSLIYIVTHAVKNEYMLTLPSARLTYRAELNMKGYARISYSIKETRMKCEPSRQYIHTHATNLAMNTLCKMASQVG
jgi:hypothetical protein